MFLFIIIGSTHGKAPAGFAPIAIGLGLTLIHVISIPVTNLSEPGAKYVACTFRGWLGMPPAMALLGSAFDRRSCRRSGRGVLDIALGMAAVGVTDIAPFDATQSARCKAGRAGYAYTLLH